MNDIIRLIIGVSVLLKKKITIKVGDIISRAKRRYKLQENHSGSWQVDDKDSILLLFTTNEVDKIVDIQLYSAIC
jgi:hypothetical protein